jgi:hypothetical protein
VRGGIAYSAVGGGLRSGFALIDVLLDVVPLQPSSCSPTVVGCRLGGYPAGRDLWGGKSAKRAAGGMSEDHDRCFSTLVLGAFSTGVYQLGCPSTLHIGWGLCDCICLVLVCRGRNSWGAVVLLFILGSNSVGVGQVRGLRGEGRRGWCEEWARSC